MRQVANKWVKFAVLSRHAGAAKHVPAMSRFNATTLQSMLTSYGFVVAKPLVGAGGHGVVKIVKVKGGYRLHDRRTIKKIGTFSRLLREINRIRHGRKYMIQRGINLATVNGRPVDYRVKIVRDKSQWKITAVVARIARSGQFVTNLCRGGRMLNGTVALRHSFKASSAMLKKKTMRGVARTCTYLLQSSYPGISQLGFDFGVDKSGRIWIFEVNTRPQ